VTIRWVHFPLHPDTPNAGLALADLFKGRDLAGMQKQMQARMEEAGLEYGDRSMTYNSRLAQELAKWADTQVGADAIHMALFRAYFVANLNIAQIDVLLEIARSVGLDAVQAGKVLEQRTFQAQVDKDWKYSYATGITGVPAFLSQNQVVVGCQPYEVLERFVQQLRGVPH
jgi:predicted DsbA family dithiol-disulfide isomerase